MPVFKDSENRLPFAPEGDYVFCVVDFECKISNGAKTRGSDQFDLKLELEGPGSHCYDSLIDHESIAWKMDTFLKCCGVKLDKNAAYEFRKDLADAKHVQWINPLGLRGWARFIVEEYPVGSGKKKNKVATFYTDKEKLPARVIEGEDEPF